MLKSEIIKRVNMPSPRQTAVISAVTRVMDMAAMVTATNIERITDMMSKGLDLPLEIEERKEVIREIKTKFGVK